MAGHDDNHGHGHDDDSHASHGHAVHGDDHDDLLLHGGHDDHGHDAHAHDEPQSPVLPPDTGNRNWWRLPFDSTTNFSLLGFFLGGSRWESNERKRVDFKLDE